MTTEPFDTVVARIDAAIGHPDMAAFRKSFSAGKDEDEMEKVVGPAAQSNGLMEFYAVRSQKRSTIPGFRAEAYEACL